MTRNRNLLRLVGASRPTRAGEHTLPQVSRSVASFSLAMALVAGALNPLVTTQSAQAATAGSGACEQTVGDSSGVTSTQVGSDCVVTFTSGNTTWTVPSGVSSVRLLLVGGGAGGMGDGGGGGGGGAGVTKDSVSVSAGAQANVSVGSGGSSNASGTATYLDLDGDSSYEWDAPGGSVGTGWAETLGGAGGAASSQNSATLLAGGNGGAGPEDDATNAAATNSGLGDGFSSDITGATLWYGGGGGGGIGSHANGFGGVDVNGGVGGKGGGGRGAAQRTSAAAVSWTYKLDGATSSYSVSETPKCLARGDYPKSTKGFPGLNGFGGGGGGGVAYGDGCSTGTTPTDDGERTSGGRGGNGAVIIRYSIPYKTVTFYPNGGAGSATTQSIVSGRVTQLTVNAFTRNGYTFAGWNTNTDGTSGDDYSDEQSVSITEPLGLYAKWTANTNQISWDSNGGSSVSSPSTFTTGGTLSLPADPVKDNKVFGGWSTSETSNQGDVENRVGAWPYSIPATGDTILYAIWLDELIFHEPFSGTSGNYLSSYSSKPTTGFTSGDWTRVPAQGSFESQLHKFGTANSGTDPKFPENSSFTIPDSNIGLVAPATYSPQFSARELATPIDFNDGETYYLSYLSYFPVSDSTASVGFVSGIPTGTTDETKKYLLGGKTYVGTTVFVDSNNATISSYHNWDNLTKSSVGVGGGSVSEAFFVLMKIQGNASGDEIINLKVFAPTDTLPETDNISDWDVTRTENLSETWTHLAVESEYRSVVDEIRFARTYEAATGAVPLHAVTFNSNYVGGASDTTQAITSGRETALTANTFSRTGYTFVGWNTDSDGITGTDFADEESVTITEPLELFAEWIADTYTVTYDYDNATGGNDDATSDFTVDGTAIALPTPTKTGYTFNGWYSDSGLTTLVGAAGDSYTPSADGTLYAKWTSTIAITTPTSGLSGTVGTAYSLTLTSSGGSGTNVFSLASGSLPAGLTLNSSTGAISGTPTAAGDQAVAVTVTDSASSSATTSSFTISVAAVTLTNVETPTVVATSGTLKSLDVSWSAVSNASSYTLKIYETDGTTLLDTISLANSLTSYTITDATGSFEAIADGTSYKISLTAVGTGNYVTSSESAKASVATLATYTVSYDSNDAGSGSVPASQTKTHGVALTLASNTGTLAKAGYTFIGWNTRADGLGTTYAAGASYTADADDVLYAKWYRASYTFNFDNNYTGDTDSTITYYSGDRVTLPTPTRDGYTLSGWYTASSGGTKVGDAGYVYSPLISDNLILRYELDDPSSYSGSGTTITDIAYETESVTGSVNATATNGPVFSTADGMSMSLDGTDDYIITGDLKSRFGVDNLEVSLFAWVYPTGNGVLVSELGQSTINTNWHDSQIEMVSGKLRFSTWGGSHSTTNVIDVWNDHLEPVVLRWIDAHWNILQCIH
ncbi:MAG: InlB B-repeat-containing protein [Aquiluna sp.]|nr:InlB B-repeat-containing protein [Aquiluna sp.]MCF8545490.1 InlB B-repeat-containing protein [Aquiluna sp.]